MVIGDVIEDIIVLADSQRNQNTDNPALITIKPGGSGANFAVWLASLGITTELTARVGKNDLSQLAHYFNSVGVAPNLQGDEFSETGKIVVLVEGNSRTFFTDRAANKNLDVSQLSLSGIDVLYISGYSVVTLGKEQSQKLIDAASTAGALIVIDPGSTSFIREFGIEEFLEAIRGVDIILPNLEEYQLLQQHLNLAEHFPEVVVTKGELGAEVIGVANVVAKEVQVIDPTGAGDAFAAKYLAERLSGADAKTALESANDFAAIAVTKSGGQP